MSLASLLNLGDVTSVKNGEITITFEGKYAFSKRKSKRETIKVYYRGLL
ncbi:hypothetical protein PWK10_17120 [Caloramator sp. Dgby_cultured_2]|nr:hypothetical protein [Caloramator sp. Dgby_cultured_2]WDU83075.1 hypothetical protein PWK10_17120 [Caloramator sp. Dgby_cultured_2]